MEASILKSTKKILGLAVEYTVFDEDILMLINSTFSTVNQLGVGPTEGFFIADENTTWDELGLPENQLNLLKTYIFLKVRMAFDPPGTSFHIAAMKEQIQEAEWRLSAFREAEYWATQQVLEEEVL